MNEQVPSKELARQIRRTAEMSAEIMRDRERTGAWEGAERVARQFDRLAKLATQLESAAPEPEAVQCPTCLEAHEMLTRALIAADNNADGDLLDKIHDAIEVMERAAQPPPAEQENLRGKCTCPNMTSTWHCPICGASEGSSKMSSDEGWRAAYQLTVAGPAGLLAQLESERARRIAAEARLAEPPGALLPGLQRAVEIIESIETPADQYEPYKSRLMDALCDAIHSAATKEAAP